MRTCGIIGGLGPESTIDYYRSIIARCREGKLDAGYPHLIVNSLDVDKGIAMLDAGRLDQLTEYLVFDEVQRRSTIPLVSIVRATADYASARHVKKVGLFGTGFTMRADFYPQEFARVGIAIVRPKESEQEFIHGKYIGELLKNKFLPETRTDILRITQRMKDEEGIEALVLAGTELPLLLRDSPPGHIEFLDTTVIHVNAIVNELLA